MASSDSPSDHYDMVVAGGGMVGASLALALSVLNQKPPQILLVESFPLSVTGVTGTPTYNPSFDARSTALSYGSRLIFESLGLWPTLQQHLADIESIHVSQRGRFGSMLMDKSDVDWSALGYVVENQWLGNTLMTTLAQQSNVTFLAPASVRMIRPIARASELTIERGGSAVTVTTDLLIVADGASSSLRQQLGIAKAERDYQQLSLIANVSFSRPHRGRAYERFTSSGPLALLPLTDSERGEPRSALVWSLPPALAQEYVVAADADLITQLQQAFGNRLGEINRIGERATYPLKLIAAKEQLRRGVVVMGNAAHSLHPVAGQGFNLALRDCITLTRILGGALDRGEPLGSLELLQHYLQRQQFDQQKTILFSDRLPALFASTQWPMGLLRDLTLGALDGVPAAKNQFIRYAAGMQDGAAGSYP